MGRAVGHSAQGEVLIVEDTPASLQLLADLLTQAGYAARRAQNGRMALLSARARPPDLILLDVRMPEMDGYEVCRRLKADPRTADVPVIFLSALRETADKLRGFQLGAVDYIAKPYPAGEVLARVRTHIELHRLQAGLEERVAQRTAEIRAAETELQASQAQLRELAGFLQTVREEERTRIARELHDELGQALTALRIDLGWLRGKCSAVDPAVPDRLASSLGLVERTVDAVRRISEDLRPAMLDSLGLAAAVEHHVSQFSERSGIPCRLEMNREEFEVAGEVATALFRVIQEALTNVARHAAAASVEVRIDEADGEIRLSVRDDGKGIDTPAGRRTFGLLGMRERIEMLGGNLNIDSRPGQGTCVQARLAKKGASGDPDSDRR